MNKQEGGSSLEEIGEDSSPKNAWENEEDESRSLEASFYYEFELEEVKVESDGDEPGQIMLSIRDITHIVVCQKKISDKVY